MNSCTGLKDYYLNPLRIPPPILLVRKNYIPFIHREVIISYLDIFLWMGVYVQDKIGTDIFVSQIFKNRTLPFLVSQFGLDRILSLKAGRYFTFCTQVCSRTEYHPDTQLSYWPFILVIPLCSLVIINKCHSMSDFSSNGDQRTKA